MTKRYHQIIVLILAVVFVAACTSASTSTPLPTAVPSAPTATVAVPTSSPPTVAPTVAPPTEPASTDTPAPPTIAPSTPLASSGTPDAGANQVVGTVVRFTVGGTEISVRIADNPTSRDFVSMLPLTLDFTDFNAMEKISYLPRRLTTQGSTGRAPANGELIYFVPWGNLGFFYNIARRDASFDDRVIPIGKVEAGYERLNELETGPVTVEVVR